MPREDFKKVFDVVREQIEKALQARSEKAGRTKTCSSGPESFDEFRNKVKLQSTLIKLNVFCRLSVFLVLYTSFL